MIIVLQILLILVVFTYVKYAAYWITEVKGLPDWLNYKPWNCTLCLTFWMLIATYVTIWLAFACLYTGVGGIILAILNAIAMLIDQKKKTIKAEDIEIVEEDDEIKVIRK